jgi:hypothetical protein
MTKASLQKARAKSWAFVSQGDPKEVARAPRENWTAIFARAGSSRRDALLLGSQMQNAFDHQEWEW